MSPGQSCPQHCPGSSDPLGVPISIRQVAELLGCSAWTVRQKYLPQGLPHLRSGRQGRLIFYRNQIVRWILLRQQKGGRR
jgi:phage terminase Nu1 subunit (DNA packaging protein)